MASNDSSSKISSDYDHLDIGEFENTRHICNRIDSFLYYTPIYMLVIFCWLYFIGY
jgi:hypothetical protein